MKTGVTCLQTIENAFLERKRDLRRKGQPAMSMTDIYVRDKFSGRIHRVGDDQHDQLVIGGDGHLHYLNLQNEDGCSTGDTRRDGCGYEFVPNVDVYGFNYDPREVNNVRISE